MRLARVLVVSQYTSAWKEWGAVVQRYDELALPQPVDIHAPETDDDFDRWLRKLTLEDGAEAAADPEPEFCSHPKLGLSRDAPMYRCSNCGNPSSVLRKCSGCGKTR